MKALIDGDILLYRSCLSVEQRMYTAYLGESPVASSPRKKELEDYEYDNLVFETYIDERGYDDALHNYTSLLDKIKQKTMCQDVSVFLTGEGNFRKEIADDYKANRTSKPILYKAVLDAILKYPETVLVEGEEADDRLGIEQTNKTIICTIDKDLDMVEGAHYNFVKDEFYEVKPEDGIRFFYTQLLMGDKVDNIIGVKGVGIKRAEKILQDKETESEMYESCLETYGQDEERVLKNARLLWIRRQENEIWQPPK